MRQRRVTRLLAALGLVTLVALASTNLELALAHRGDAAARSVAYAALDLRRATGAATAGIAARRAGGRHRQPARRRLQREHRRAGRTPRLRDWSTAYNALGGRLRSQRQDLYQRELLLDTVIQASPLALMLTNATGTILYANLAARQLLSRRPQARRTGAVAAARADAAVAARGARRQSRPAVHGHAGATMRRCSTSRTASSC